VNLEQLRAEIDAVDQELIELLGRRFQLTRRIGRYKHANALAHVDSVREDAISERWRALAVANGVAPDLAAKIIGLIVDQVVKEHGTTAT